MEQVIRKLDEQVIKKMKLISNSALRLSFGIIFIWFGILKPLGYSPATSLIKSTVRWLPFGDSSNWVTIIGLWEVIIGILFLFKRTTRIAILLLFLHMMGTFMPLVVLPKISFNSNNVLLLTMEAQYIIKNIMIISAALVLGGQLLNQESKQ